MTSRTLPLCPTLNPPGHRDPQRGPLTRLSSVGWVLVGRWEHAAEGYRARLQGKKESGLTERVPLLSPQLGTPLRVG